MARAAALIVAGRAGTVLAGGSRRAVPILYRELSRLGLTSPRHGAAGGCWPFDRRASGSVLGEGATVPGPGGEMRPARAGARPYAVLSGAAWGNLPAPAHGVPVRRRRDPAVVRRALAAAGVAPDDVDAVYASGHHRELDACELDLLDAAFRSRRAGPADRPHAARRRARGPGRAAVAAAAAALAVAGCGRRALPDLALRSAPTSGSRRHRAGGAGSRAADARSSTAWRGVAAHATLVLRVVVRMWTGGRRRRMAEVWAWCPPSTRRPRSAMSCGPSARLVP